MGALDIVLWHLLQTDGNDRGEKMSTSAILGFAIVVFFLMLTGLVLTAREFLKISEDPSAKKGWDQGS